MEESGRRKYAGGGRRIYLILVNVAKRRRKDLAFIIGSGSVFLFFVRSRIGVMHTRMMGRQLCSIKRGQGRERDRIAQMHRVISTSHTVHVHDLRVCFFFLFTPLLVSIHSRTCPCFSLSE